MLSKIALPLSDCRTVAQVSSCGGFAMMLNTTALLALPLPMEKRGENIMEKGSGLDIRTENQSWNTITGKADSV